MHPFTRERKITPPPPQKKKKTRRKTLVYVSCCIIQNIVFTPTQCVLGISWCIKKGHFIWRFAKQKLNKMKTWILLCRLVLVSTWLKLCLSKPAIASWRYFIERNIAFLLEVCVLHEMLCFFLISQRQSQ